MFWQLLISGLVIGSVYGLIALGYSLIYKASGLMTFAQGDLLTVGAFLGVTFFNGYHLPFVVSLLLSVLIAFFIGLGVEKFIIRRLLNKKVMAIYIVLATIAISYIIQNGTMIGFGTKTLYFPAIFPFKTIKLGTISVQTESLGCILVAVCCMILLHFFMSGTKLGTAMRAASMDPTAAEACGIDVSLTTGITWGLAAGLAALGGMLIGPIFGVYTTLGATIGKKGSAAAVSGGYGNMYGAIVGGLLLGIVETMVAGFWTSELKDMVSYVILLAFLFLRPTGLFNERAIQD